MRTFFFRRIKNNQSGMTLVEVIISIAIFAMIMVASGQFISFTLASWNKTQSDSFTLARTSNFMQSMEKEVRQAIRPSPSQRGIQVFDLFNSEESLESGSRVDIYTGFYKNVEGNDGLNITYIVYDDSLWKIYGDPPTQPGDLDGLRPVIHRITRIEDETGNDIDFFTLDSDSQQLIIRFDVLNAGGQEESLFEVNTSLTVRSQGVI